MGVRDTVIEQNNDFTAPVRRDGLDERKLYLV